MSSKSFRTVLGGALSVGLLAAPAAVLPAAAAPLEGTPTEETTASAPAAGPAAAGPGDDLTVSITSFNDFHGEVSAGLGSTKLAVEIEQWRAAKGAAATLLTSAGDNIGGSKFASMIQADEPALEILNVLGVQSSTAGNHEGAQSASSLAEAQSTSSVFHRIVTETSGEVDAIFTGHSHSLYDFEAPNGPGVRPVMQADSSARHLATADFLVDPATREVTFAGSANLPVDATDEEVAALAATNAVVSAVQSIEEAAVSQSAVLGQEKVGEITGSITTDYAPDKVGSAGGDRSQESALNNLLATALRDELADPALGGARIGFMNAGGVRDELFFDKTGRAAGAPAKAVPGDVSFQELANIFPFGNTLYTVKLSGADIRQVLEQQWRVDGSGVESKLALGTTDNLSYTFDTTRPVGERVTGEWLDGEPLDPQATYSVATLSFLAEGGDGFTAFTNGSGGVDTGYSDLEALVNFVEAKPPLSPDFTKRGIEIAGAPGRIEPGQSYTFEVRAIDLGSDGAPVSETVYLDYRFGAEGYEVVGEFAVVDGAASVSFTAPDELFGGLLVVGTEASGSAVPLPSLVAGEVPDQDRDTDGNGSGGPGRDDDEDPGHGSDDEDEDRGTGHDRDGKDQDHDGDHGGNDDEEAAGSGSGDGPAAEGQLASTGVGGALPLGIGALLLVGLGVAALVAAKRRGQTQPSAT